jgi:deoxyribonuclease (pyrimidine dimer)
MVRVNLINPAALADQHLIAEYNEILMLLGYVRKYPQAGDIPDSYRLGKGHITFFKDKLLYLKRRHELIKTEMKKRGFVAAKDVDLTVFPRELCNDWNPGKKDAEIIKERLLMKLAQKPGYYRYWGKARDMATQINKAKLC